MGKIEDYKIGNSILQIYSRLPYRLECQFEELIFEMRKNMAGKPTDFDLKGFSISQKVSINNFLLINAIVEPKITETDLDNNEHPLNDKFREIGDNLFDRYTIQYTEKMDEKKTLLKSPG